MEVQRPSCYSHGHRMTATCYSSYSSRDCAIESGSVSRTLFSPSFLPRIVDSALQSKRMERFAPAARKSRPKVICPSKRGYHRRGNSPTFKLLTEVSEKLQVLADRQEAKSLATKGKGEEGNDMDINSDEYFGDCSSTNDEEQQCVSPPKRSESGILLELDFSSELSSPGSIVLSPLIPVHHYSRSSAKSKLHLYLPRVTETAERAESPDGNIGQGEIKNDSSGRTRNQDYANYYDLRHGLSDRDDRKSCDYKRSSLTYSKTCSKSGHKKSKTKKSKLSKMSGKKQSSSAESKSSMSVLPSIQRDVITSNNKEVKTDHVDFLNDVPTLISEQRDLLQFSEACYTLPDVIQHCGVSDSYNDSNNLSTTSLGLIHRNDCQPVNLDNKGQSKSDCSVCKYKLNSTIQFVDRIYGTGADEIDDLNNNSRANGVVGCVKC